MTKKYSKQAKTVSAIDDMFISREVAEKANLPVTEVNAK
jgi:hypothetical protein